MRKLGLSTLLLLNVTLIFGQIWEARHNLSPSAYQKVFDQLNSKGYKPTESNFVFINGQYQYTAVWNYAPNSIWEARSNLTPDDYQAYFDDLTPKGYMPTEISANTVNGKPIFSAIWEKRGTNIAWEARSNLTASEFQTYFDDLTPKGYVPTEIAAYSVNAQPRFAAVWVKQPGVTWEARSNLTASEFQKYFDDFTPKGYVPTEMYAYNDNGTIKFGGVWQKMSGIEWQARYGLTNQEYQNTFNTMASNNFVPYLVNSYVVNGQVYYMAAWKKQHQPNIVITKPQPTNQVNKYNTNSSKVLPVRPVFQQTQVWCWLAVGEMVCKHFGIPSINPGGNYQCGIIGSISGPSSPCYRNCFNCVVPSGSNQGTINMLANYAMIAGQKRFYYSESKEISENQVIQNIDNGQPIIAGTSYNNRIFNYDSEHVVLIVGYEIINGQLNLIINDPFNYTTSNPYIKSGGRMIKNNQYIISYNNFRYSVFWNWAVFNIDIR